VAGKTGTAQTASGGSYRRSTYRASFAGFFPADDPKVVMLVMLDAPTTSGYGGVVAAPIFRRIAERWVGTFPEIAARMAPPDTLAAPSPRPVPEVEGLPVSVAAQRLSASGFRPDISSANAAVRLVASQAPSSGASEMPGAPVEVALSSPVPNASYQERAAVPVWQAASLSPPPGGTSPETGAPSAAPMPDLVGLSARQAVLWLRAQGIEAAIEGSGVVRAQSPEPGILTTRATITCD
jgi:cell division protein FtsI (penicillin-binding protein 3)